MRHVNPKQIALLRAFNNQVLAYQDDALTLAYLLLADVERAFDLVQKVFIRTYQEVADFADSIRPRVFREIIETYHDRSQSERPCSMGIYDDPIMLALQQLPYEERCIEILIDIMNGNFSSLCSLFDRTREVDFLNRVKVMGETMAGDT